MIFIYFTNFYNVFLINNCQIKTHILFEITVLLLGIYPREIVREVCKYTYWNITNNSRMKQFKGSSVAYIVEYYQYMMLISIKMIIK